MNFAFYTMSVMISHMRVGKRKTSRTVGVRWTSSTFWQPQERSWPENLDGDLEVLLSKCIVLRDHCGQKERLRRVGMVGLPRGLRFWMLTLSIRLPPLGYSRAKESSSCLDQVLFGVVST